MRAYKAAVEKLNHNTQQALEEVDISMNEAEELEAAMENAEFSLHANALSWISRDYASYDNSRPDLESILYLQ